MFRLRDYRHYAQHDIIIFPDRTPIVRLAERAKILDTIHNHVNDRTPSIGLVERVKTPILTYTKLNEQSPSIWLADSRQAYGLLEKCNLNNVF